MRCEKHCRYQGRGFPKSGCRACLDVYADRWRGVALAATEQVQRAKDALRVGCHHEPRYIDVYRWEHDNGYGRQRMVDGEYCKACGKEWPWGKKWSGQ